MKEFHRRVVGELLRHGYAYMPVDAVQFASAASAVQLFLAANREHWGDWSFERRAGGQVGIIQEGQEVAGATHLSLCYDHNLTRHRPIVALPPHSRQCLQTIAEFYRVMKLRVCEIAHELSPSCGISGLHGRVKNAFEGGNAHSSLWMSSGTHGRRALNELVDDSVLTVYLGGRNGNLYLKNTDEWLFAEPPQGSALVFFGALVDQLENPELRPATHRFEHTGTGAYLSSYLNVQIEPVRAPATSGAEIHQFTA